MRRTGRPGKRYVVDGVTYYGTAAAVGAVIGASEERGQCLTDGEVAQIVGCERSTVVTARQANEIPCWKVRLWTTV